MNPTQTLVGNLTSAPELRHTTTGRSVAKARIAFDPVTGRNDDGTLKTAETVFFNLELWGALAEGFSELPTGTSVVVVGELRHQTYETEDGTRKTNRYLRVIAGGPNLDWTTVENVRRRARQPAPAETPAQPGPRPGPQPSAAADGREEEFDIDNAY